MKSAFIYESDFVVKLTLELKILRDDRREEGRRKCWRGTGRYVVGPVDLEGREGEKCAAY